MDVIQVNGKKKLLPDVVGLVLLWLSVLMEM